MITSFTSHRYDPKGQRQILNATRIAIEVCRRFFAPLKVRASPPYISESASQITVTIFYHNPDPGAALNINTINSLGDLLTDIYQKPVGLRLINLRYAYMDPHILAQTLSIAMQSAKFVNVIRELFKVCAPVKHRDQAVGRLPAILNGIKVELRGRLETESSRPRFTVQTAILGSLRTNMSSTVHCASYTATNKKGAYTTRVWLGMHIPKQSVESSVPEDVVEEADAALVSESESGRNSFSSRNGAQRAYSILSVGSGTRAYSTTASPASTEAASSTTDESEDSLKIEAPRAGTQPQMLGKIEPRL
jgi:hypothetical protein